MEKYVPTVEGDHDRGGISRYGRDLPTWEGSPNTGGTYFPYGKSNDLKYYHYFMFLYA